VLLASGWITCVPEVGIAVDEVVVVVVEVAWVVVVEEVWLVVDELLLEVLEAETDPLVTVAIRAQFEEAAAG